MRTKRKRRDQRRVASKLFKRREENRLTSSSFLMLESVNSSQSTSPVEGTTETIPNVTSSPSLSFPFPFLDDDEEGSSSTMAMRAFDGGTADGKTKDPLSREEISST